MATSLELVVPVLNEERDLAPSIEKLLAFLPLHMGRYDWRIIIADNGSTDSTPEVAKRLAGGNSQVEWTRLEERGRGRALRTAWLGSEADIVSYMDVDLSTDLEAFPKLVGAVSDEGYDIAIGSRLARGAEVIGRPPLRGAISRVYSFIFRALFAELFIDPFSVRSMFLSGFRDAQCGFKALSRRSARELVPLVMDSGWFFDTELLVLAEKNGYRIKELPVRWIDDPDSRVEIVPTAYEDLKGLMRLRFGGLRSASRRLSSTVPNE